MVENQGGEGQEHLTLDEDPKSDAGEERKEVESRLLTPSSEKKAQDIQPTLDELDVQVIRQCSRQSTSLSPLSLVKAGDKINDIASLILNSQPLSRFTDLENLHFVDESGEALRFQVLSGNESRFFRVDSEGLPIRIDAPERFQGLSPQDQRQALINAYSSPIFTQTQDRYESPKSDVSLQATQENGHIKSLQIFAKQGEKVGSLGCAVDESGASILCQCL